VPFVFSSDTFSTEDPEETGEEAAPAIIFSVLTREMEKSWWKSICGNFV